MDIRSLQYFLAVAQEGSITRAAESLHLTQPTLSRQLRDLEDELGKTLFIRGKKRITLTSEGLLLRDRAEEILAMTQRTQQEIMQASSDDISGTLVISTIDYHFAMPLINTLRNMRQECPGVHLHFLYSLPLQTLELLNQGIAELGIIHTTVLSSSFDSLCLHRNNQWGLLMRKDDPLAKKDALTPSDWLKLPLWSMLYSRTGYTPTIQAWAGKYFAHYHFVSTYCNYTQAESIAEYGLGYPLYYEALCDQLSSTLCFRPCNPPMETDILLVWNRYRRLSKPAERFIEILQKYV